MLQCFQNERSFAVIGELPKAIAEPIAEWPDVEVQCVGQLKRPQRIRWLREGVSGVF